MTKTPFIEFVHFDNNVTSAREFLEKLRIKLTPLELYNYSDNSFNIEKAWEEGDTAPLLPTSDFNLRSVVVVKVPVEAITREVSDNDDTDLPPIIYNKNFNPFIDEKMAEILEHPGYVPVQFADGVNNQGKFANVLNNITVWIHMKALGGGPGKVFNVTEFVENLSTSHSKRGGDWSLELSPIIGIFDREKGWKIDEETLSQYVKSNGAVSFVNRVNVNEPAVLEEFKRNKFFFHNVIQTNDVVFIKFEPLEMETPSQGGTVSGSTSALNVQEELILEPIDLENKNWDMIGLVDTNTIDFSAISSNISIQITGRDLNKLLSEDGVYFYPLDFLDKEGQYYDSDLTFVRGDKVDTPLKRIITGELNFFNAYVDRPIEFSLRFVFNLLANVQIVDESLFKYYDKDNLTYREQFFTPVSKANTDLVETYPVEVQRKIAELNAIDNVVRQKNAQKELVQGIWQIVKLVVDKEVANRRLVDSSISTQQGNLLDFVNKICQEPFCEFWGDTYGSQFYFLSRKPPFDEFSYKRVYTIDIEESVVYQDNLSFDDAEVYSWYRLNPKGNYFGDETVTLAEFPAVFFSRYVEIWGSRPLEIVTNYIDYKNWAGSSLETRTTFLREQSLQDLTYLIETNAYKPFTRTGTIAIKGDRRIKTGINIRYKPTGEIFHVVGVKNNFSVNTAGSDRVTVLQVERGMVEEYMLRKDFNYFKIINVEKRVTGSTETYNFSVNDEIFDFFLKRKQFQ